MENYSLLSANRSLGSFALHHNFDGSSNILKLGRLHIGEFQRQVTRLSERGCRIGHIDWRLDSA